MFVPDCKDMTILGYIQLLHPSILTAGSPLTRTYISWENNPPRYILGATPNILQRWKTGPSSGDNTTTIPQYHVTSYAVPVWCILGWVFAFNFAAGLSC
jgi:hypothetical protein